MATRNRIAMLIGALALVAGACGDGSTDATATPQPADTAQPTTAPPPTTGAAGPAAGALPDGPSALDNMADPAFPEPLVDPSDVISGGPPPDGIPPIDQPQFLPVVDHLDLLPADEPVVAIEIDGDARAYPVRIMIWHEIVNDTVGGTPVAVTYCPLCNSAVGYLREIDGVETTFGTSGRLYASALVMYDRATESLWTHFDGRAVIGVLTGTELTVVPTPLMSWDAFRSTYPDGRVLDESQTGFTRRYGANPYVGYDNPEASPFLFRGDVDTRAVAMQRVVGIEIDGESVALALDAIAGDGPSATTVTVGGEALIVLWEPGQSSALESGTVDGGRDVGTVGVFRSSLDGETIDFEVSAGAIIDAATESRWTAAGVAVAGDRAGAELERVPHLDTFWFAWSTYRPETTLLDGSAE